MALISVERYLALLPDGLGSHPLATAKGSVVRPWLEGEVAVSLRAVEDLPGGLRRYLDSPPTVNAWVPEVVLAALILAAGEAHFQSEHDLQEYIRVTNRAALQGPLYRILFEVLSVERLLKGAAQRWAAFHRGSTLEVVESAPGRAIMDLRHLPNIFGESSLRGHGTSFALAAELANAKDARADFVSLSADRTRYTVTWR